MCMGCSSGNWEIERLASETRLGAFCRLGPVNKLQDIWVPVLGHNLQLLEGLEYLWGLMLECATRAEISGCVFQGVWLPSCLQSTVRVFCRLNLLIIRASGPEEGRKEQRVGRTFTEPGKFGDKNRSDCKVECLENSKRGA